MGKAVTMSSAPISATHNKKGNTELAMQEF